MVVAESLATVHHSSPRRGGEGGTEGTLAGQDQGDGR